MNLSLWRTWRANAVSFFKKTWKRFLSLARWVQILILVLLLIVVGGIVVLARAGGHDSAAAAKPTVVLQRIDSFGNNSNGVDVLGTVQSVSEADILAQSGGTVKSVHTTLGATVSAGFVIADLDSAAASAAVLQAKGGYDAALAAQRATALESQNSTGSFAEAQTAARNTYQSTYTALDTTILQEVDQFFGSPSAVGPQLQIAPLYSGDKFPRARTAIGTMLDAWQASLASANTTDPLTLLSTAQTNLTTVSTFLTDLSALANDRDSHATPAQLSALATARTTVNSLLSTVSAARDAYNAKKTAAAVGQTQSSGSGVTSAQATVEQALGGLRSAQAAYEKTIVRAPIAGTINFLPIHVGDYVSPTEHVATVARNNALEIVMHVAQEDSNRLAVGDTVTIAGSYKGVVTTIAPALDPTTKQIEVHVAVNDGADLVNGQSVQVALPALAVDAAPARATATSTSAMANGVQLPLTAVKLLPNERDIFTVDATGHIVAHPVSIGTVIGDRIQIMTPLSPDLQIVVDARGLSVGDSVLVATSTSP